MVAGFFSQTETGFTLLLFEAGLQLKRQTSIWIAELVLPTTYCQLQIATSHIACLE